MLATWDAVQRDKLAREVSAVRCQRGTRAVLMLQMEDVVCPGSGVRVLGVSSLFVHT